MENVLEGPLAALRESEISLITDVAVTLGDVVEASENDRNRLMEMAKDLSEMFFLVAIIGEFNSGKSTFVNALLQDTLLPMGITPTTEMIELVRYSETVNRKPIQRGDSLREWSHPNTGAIGVAIVDTPGTGSVFERHETTAKEFLHRSDMVIFVLSAKRAFAETERIYLETAKNYGKKIILVVNQIDLLDPSERDQVRRFIEQQVKEHLGLQPLLFMVSAKEALEKQAADPSAGGMDAVRAHLRGVLAESPPAKQKLLAQLETAGKMISKYRDVIHAKADLVKTDTVKVREVETELTAQSVGLDSQLTNARAEVDKVFVGLRQRGLNFIDANLSIRKVLGGSTRRDKLQAEFQDVVIGRSIRDLNEATGDYINAVVDQSRSYWRDVIDRLNKLLKVLEQEVSGLDANVYAEQREGLEEAIRLAESELKSYSSGRLVDEMQQDFQTSMSGFRTGALATVGGLAGLIAAAAMPGPIIGAGAAALAPVFLAVSAPLAAVGGIVAFRHFRHISHDMKQEFNGRVDRLMKTYHTALDDLTRKERNRLSKYGTQVLTPIFSRLEVIAKRYSDQLSKFEVYTKRLETLKKGIEES